MDRMNKDILASISVSPDVKNKIIIFKQNNKVSTGNSYICSRYVYKNKHNKYTDEGIVSIFNNDIVVNKAMYSKLLMNNEELAINYLIQFFNIVLNIENNLSKRHLSYIEQAHRDLKHCHLGFNNSRYIKDKKSDLVLNILSNLKKAFKVNDLYPEYAKYYDHYKMANICSLINRSHLTNPYDYIRQIFNNKDISDDTIFKLFYFIDINENVHYDILKASKLISPLGKSLIDKAFKEKDLLYNLLDTSALLEEYKELEKREVFFNEI